MSARPPVVPIAVAASNELACAAAVQVAAQGGNSVDAALAATLVTTVSEPGLVSLAGAGYVTVAPPDGSPPVTIDGGVVMPGKGVDPVRLGGGLRTVSTDYAGGVTMTVGHGSVATPGALRALDMASRRYGALPWQEVLGPAIEVADGGFPHGQASHHYLTFVHESVFGWQPESHAALHDEAGELIGPGQRVVVPQLVDSLRLIAEQGADAFYAGDLARTIVADMEAADGLVTAEDLASYRAAVRPSAQAGLADWQVCTNPAPAVGGVVLAAMVSLLAGRPSSAGWDADDRLALVAVQRAVLQHRTQVLDVAEDRITAAQRLLALVERRDLELISSPSTTHVSVVGADGSACAITVSCGYNSGVLVPGTGIWLNNCLGEQELTPHGPHGQPPGTRLLTAMAPTVGRRSDGAVLAIGSPGSDRIPTAISQTLLSHVNGGLPLAAAVAHPRAHVRVVGGDLVDHEADWPVPGNLTLPTRAMPAHSMYFGGVGVAMWTPDGGLAAAGDPRRTGAVAISG